MHTVRLLLVGVALATLFSRAALGVDQPVPRIGDAGWEPDKSRFDPRFPAMAEWARAGVRGGIPPRDASRLFGRVRPGEDLQMAIDRAAAAGGGVVLLAEGRHDLHRTLELRSGVILRGEHRDRSVIAVRIRAQFFRKTGGSQVSALVGRGIRRAGLEDLTVRYAAVDFEPLDFAAFDAPWDRRVFHQPEARDDSLFVHLVTFQGSSDCWVDGCNLLWAGAHPLSVLDSQHLTMRGNRIDRAYVKMDSQYGGYYSLVGSSHCLLVDEHVSRIRHFAIMHEASRYNVVLGGNFETDLNFHHGDGGDNLIEGARFATPVWHSWSALARGVPGRHRPPGPRNLLFNLQMISKGVPGFTARGPLSLPGVIYVVGTPFDVPLVSALPDEPPRASTFYAVRRSPAQ